MKKHTKIYFKHYNIGEQDWIECEVCSATAVDIHHIDGRGEGMDVIENLIALCRSCHNKTHDSIIIKEFLKNIVKNRK